MRAEIAEHRMPVNVRKVWSRGKGIRGWETTKPPPVTCRVRASKKKRSTSRIARENRAKLHTSAQCTGVNATDTHQKKGKADPTKRIEGSDRENWEDRPMHAKGEKLIWQSERTTGVTSKAGNCKKKPLRFSRYQTPKEGRKSGRETRSNAQNESLIRTTTKQKPQPVWHSHIDQQNYRKVGKEANS